MLTVDPSLPIPPFEQIKRQVVAQRESGALPAHHRLPPVRTLAAQLGLAPNTVARAYRELEQEGVLETRGRHGSFVTGAAQSPDRARTAAARAYVEAVRALGVDDESAVALVRDALGRG